MATIDSLANETLCKIMDLLKEPSPRPWDTRSYLAAGRYDALRAAALVCSRWKDPAQRALFEDVDVSDLSGSRSKAFLASPEQLRQCTRSMRVSAIPDARPAWFKVGTRCDGIQSLEIFGRNGNVKFKNLSRPGFADLRHLSIHAWSVTYNPRDCDIPLPSRLSSLALWVPDLDNSAAACLAAISLASKDTLDSLYLRLDWIKRDVIMSLAFCDVGPQFRSLIIDARPFVLQCHVNLFFTFTSLQKFSWNGCKPKYPLQASDVGHLQMILDAFPSPATLVHFSLGTDDFSSLEHLISLLGHSTFQLLNKLDFPLLPTSTPMPFEQVSVIAKMTKACDDRNIEWSMGGVKVE